jgi:O-antigen/teichoic acid export membrane protein
MLMGVQNLIGPAVAEVAARPDSDELRRFVTKSTWLFVLLMTPYATAAFFGGEWFLKLYDGQYDGFGMVVSILALASLTHAFGFASSRALFARGGARHDVIANSLALVMMLGPGSIAIYTNGIRGAAGVMLASLAVSNLYRVIAFLRMTKGAT